ncbi:HNH endonuclease signature motif containing protein [Actinoplanes sp. NPDC049668]|uniref:HNH endonuclease n=1 Tax=unclassified Actinoplanes TaxID=2626549 RepID=UPI0033B6C9E3
MSKAWAGGSDTRWRAFRLKILERDRWQCTIQGTGCTGRAEHVDHIHPLGQGGDKYDPANCRAACAWCNLSRPTHIVEQPAPRPVSSW